MNGQAENIPNSASHEIDRWPWQDREYYGTLAAVVFAHALLVAIAMQLLVPELQNHRLAGEIQAIKTDPAVAWLDNSATSPPDPSSDRPAFAAQRLPFATGIAPENDPQSQIALPLPPAKPEPAPQPEKKPEPQPDPEPPPPLERPAAAQPAPVSPPKEKAHSLPVLSLAPAPAPKPQPKPIVNTAPAPKPAPVTPPTPKPTPKPEPEPERKPALKPAIKPAPQPPPVIQPVAVPAPAPPPVQPALRPVIAVRPEIVAPAPVAGPATTIAPPSQTPSSGTFGAAPGQGSQGPGDDLSAYHRLIHDTFHRNWRQPTSLPSGISTYQTKVKIVIARDGTIVDTSFVRASGNPIMDDSVHQAVTTVRRIAPLPPYIESANYSVVINFQLD